MQPLDAETLRHADEAALAGPPPAAGFEEKYTKPPRPAGAATATQVDRSTREAVLPPEDEEKPPNAEVQATVQQIKDPALRAICEKLWHTMQANPLPPEREAPPAPRQAPQQQPREPTPAPPPVQPLSPAPRGYRLQDDNLLADATWLNMTLRGVPVLRGVFCGKQATKRYGRWVWRAAVAALVQEAPGRIKDPAAYVVQTADNLAKRKSFDVRKAADYYFQAAWGPEALAFANVRTPDG